MKQLTRLLIGGLLLGSVASCSNDKSDDASPNSPREYEVEYRISSPSASTADFVLYANETGGNTQLANVTLPVTYKFKRTMKLGDNASVLGSLSGGNASSEITTVILLNGQEKKRDTGRGVNAQSTAVFVIGQ